jgi:putative sterol carrier protein
MMTFMGKTVNKELAAQRSFTMVWNFEGPGGGAWAFNVANGTCKVTQGLPPRFDLQISMKPENFHKLVAKMTPPPVLMLTGQMKIKGFGAMNTFAKLFPEPSPEQQIEIAM